MVIIHQYTDGLIFWIINFHRMRKPFKWNCRGATHMAQQMTTSSKTQFTKMAIAAKITIPEFLKKNNTTWWDGFWKIYF